MVLLFYHYVMLLQGNYEIIYCKISPEIDEYLTNLNT